MQRYRVCPGCCWQQRLYCSLSPAQVRRQWQQVFPIKPSQVQSRCVAGHLFFSPKPSKPLLSLPFPFMPLGCLRK